MADKNAEPQKPIAQGCFAFGLALPLIIWMNSIEAPADACGIPVKMWLMTYWITNFVDLLLQCVAMTLFRPLIFLSLFCSLFYFAWLIYGFALWNKDVNNCREDPTTPEVQQLGTFMFVWLCITMPYVFLCAYCCVVGCLGIAFRMVKGG